MVARVQITQLGAGRTEDRERVTGAPIGYARALLETVDDTLSRAEW